MASNLFTDFQDRVDILKKYSHARAVMPDLEKAFGDPSLFQSQDEAIEFYAGAAEELGKFCAKEVQPTAGAIDSEGVHLVNGEVKSPETLNAHLRKAKELGLFAGPIARKYDGLNLPRVVLNLGLEMLGHACPNTALTLAANSMGDFIQLHGSEGQLQRILPKFMSLEWGSSMSLTEADAGSDLGRLRTTALKQGNHYIVNGTKRFISNGHGEITFLLARTNPESRGLEGLSVLIVQRHWEGKENFKVAKIEDKICLHSSATCELVFENSVGELLGEEGNGFKIMLDLMNQARTAMGAIALGLSASALETATEYAKTRVTMGKPIIKHPMVADILYEMDLEIFAMRFLLAEASGADDWMRSARELKDEAKYRRWRKRYLRLTPLVKYITAEKVITHTRNAVQIFGGYGVCKEYPVERLFRESIIYGIYEGTSQIQSLMVLKDTLKDVAKNSTGFLGSLAGAWAESKIARDPVKSKLLEARNELNQAIKTILMHIIKTKFKSDISALREKKIQDFLREYSLNLLSPNTDLTYPFLVAERLTRIVCDYYTLKCMVDHYQPNDTALRERIIAFANLILPRMRMENTYMVDRLPATLEFISKQEGQA